MAPKSAEFLIAMLSSTALVLTPVAAQAGGQVGGMGQFGNGGHPGVSNLRCPQTPRPNFTVNNRSLTINKTNNINNTLNVYKPVNIENNVNVYKPVTVTTNIDNSKNVEINKNLNISKNVTINKGSSEAEAAALAIAAALAVSSSSSSAVVNFNGSASASSYSNSASFNNSGFFGNFGVSSYVAEAPGMAAGGDVNINVSPAEVVAQAACVFQDATVIKAIHAICVSEDRHEFPASHMVGDTWINAGYEGEIARCLPGSSLKVTVGSVVQSSEGAAVSNARAETMMCAPREALRHFKNGVLKCAPAMAVPDCTERTNLRKFGTGDMFFSYVTRVCLETGRELVGGISREDEVYGARSYGYRQSSLRGPASGY